MVPLASCYCCYAPTEDSLQYLNSIMFFFLLEFVLHNAEVKALKRPQTAHKGPRKNFTGTLRWLNLKPKDMLKVMAAPLYFSVQVVRGGELLY